MTDNSSEDSVPRRENRRSRDSTGRRATDVRLTELLVREERVRLAEARLASGEITSADLKDANERLVLTTIKAYEQAEEAVHTRQKAEDKASELGESERSLLAEAVFRDRFLGIVGHDLRNPLFAITMSARLLLPQHAQSELTVTELAQRILASSARMASIIRQLLDLTRAKFGERLPIQRQPANLERICHSAVDELKSGRERVGHFHCEFRGDMNGFWDAPRLEQVVSNLCGNALDHGDPQSPVEVKVVGTETSVVLEVHNQGPPIPRDLLPSIFEPFRQADQGKNAPSGSLGLGLYIASEIVRAHEGKIDVTTTASEGTTFRVHLPRGVPAADRESPR